MGRQRETALDTRGTERRAGRGIDGQVTGKTSKLTPPVGDTYSSDGSGDKTHQSLSVIERDQCLSLSISPTYVQTRVIPSPAFRVGCCCWLVAYCPSNTLVYLRDGSAQTICTCCHNGIEVADQTFHFKQSQNTDTGPTSPSTDPITPGAWQDSHCSANF